jgi:uncharacterized protein YndB with AHSA1/START domain
VSQFKIVQDYAYPPEKVWRALTDPVLIPLWTSTGKGAHPVGFSTAVGTRFQFVAKPMPGWDGIVNCEMLEAREPSFLRFTWRGGHKDEVTTVACLLEPYRGGTRLTWEHTGFRGVGGFLVCKVLASVRRKMLAEGVPPVLADLDDRGKLRSAPA